ncbi:MAG TPA: alpha/beta hydrolase [Anaerolineales bacterium]|nr:alpha/beta hydrolase [Anaerolineales bacterium]
MSFSYRDETRELNELTRQEASGSFIQLSDGFTHYELSNPAAEHTVVLAHGFSVPYFIYDPTFEFLTRAGFRVLRYDLYGRGFSDRPDGLYNIELFVRQLGDLLDGLRLTSPVSLVGLSTGGPITAAFTARFPERVDKLVLIDPVGAKPLPFAGILKVASMPLVGEAIAGLVRSDRLNNRLVASLFEREFIEHFQPRYIVQMRFKGFRRAILSTIRNKMLDSFLDVYERIGKMNKPVLLFWGRNDPTVPFQHSDLLRRAMPAMEFHAIENCGHIPHYEKPDDVNPILLQFLKDSSLRGAKSEG